jgi:hypothetical protein
LRAEVDAYRERFESERTQKAAQAITTVDVWTLDSQHETPG